MAAGDEFPWWILSAVEWLRIFARQTLLAYSLADPGGDSWTSNGDSSKLDIRAIIPTRDYIVMVSTLAPKRLNEKADRIFQLLFYKPSGGRVESVQNVTEVSGITSWQVVDGGVYYVSDDHRLHFLRGTRE